MSQWPLAWEASQDRGRGGRPAATHLPEEPKNRKGKEQGQRNASSKQADESEQYGPKGALCRVLHEVLRVGSAYYKGRLYKREEIEELATSEDIQFLHERMGTESIGHKFNFKNYKLENNKWIPQEFI